MKVRLFTLAVVSLLCVVAPAFGDVRPATLEWDASPEASVAGYIVYVGRTSGSYDEAFDVQQQTSFVYTDAVAGRPYFFSVAAYTPGPHIGPRSEEVLFFAGTTIALPSRSTGQPNDEDAAPTAAADARGRDEARVLCLGSTECYRVESLGDVAGNASALTQTADGRALFIENGKHVRVIEDDLLVSEFALSAAASSTFAGLVLDSGFTDTRFVYVGVVEASPDGSRQLNIVRYREVANTLGEGAVIVAGLPLPVTGDASLAVDAGRRLYVAMPAALASDPRAARYAGMVLRFESDGTSVRDDGAGAPVFSQGYAQPTSLAWAGIENALWLAGKGSDGVGALARLSLNRVSTGSAVAPEGVALAPGAAALSLTSSSDARAALLFVDESGGVFQMVAAAGGVDMTPWIAPDVLGGRVVSAVRAKADDDILLAVTTGLEPAAVSSQVLRLRRQ